MDFQDKRTNLATATVVNQGIAWCETYGQRSAAAFLVHRAIPRPVIQRVLDSGAIRGAPNPERGARCHTYLINQADT
jgi:hypothetical protein